MPRIPTLDQRVATAPLPGVRLSPEAPSAAFQPAAPTDLSGAARFFEAENQKAEQLAVLDADNQLSDLSTELHSAALKRRGKDALGATKDIAEAWTTRTAEIEGALRSETARMAFQQRSIARWGSLYEAVERHADGEARTYDDQTTNAALVNRMNDALTNYADPARVAGAVAEQQAILKDYARRNGLPPELLQEKLATATSKTHTAVIDRMLSNGQDLAAAEYYGKVKDAVVGADTLSVEKALEVGGKMGEGQRQADQIIGRKGITRTDAFELAREIKDPAVREETEKRLDTEFRRRDQAEQDTREQRFKAAADYAEQGRRPPATLWKDLTIQERSAIDTRIKQLTTREAPTTVDAIYYRLVRGAASNPQGFAKENLLLYRAYLSPSDFQELARTQAAVIKGDDKADAQLVGIRTSQRIVDDALLSIGVDPTPDPKKNKGDVEKGLQFRRAVDDEVHALEQRTQKKATPDEVQAISDRLLTTGAVVGSGGFFSGPTQRRVFEQEPGERLVITAADIPRQERVKLEAAIRGAGGVVSDATVLRLYTRTIGRMLKPAAR